GLRVCLTSIMRTSLHVVAGIHDRIPFVGGGPVCRRLALTGRPVSAKPLASALRVGVASVTGQDCQHDKIVMIGRRRPSGSLASLNYRHLPATMPRRGGPKSPPDRLPNHQA